MLRAALLALALLWPALAFGQAWATKEYCTVSQPRLDPSLFAYPTLEALQAEAAKVPNGVGKFWRVATPSGQASYLWGTMHSNDPLILSLPNQVEQAIQDARVVLTELDFRPLSRADIDKRYVWDDVYLTGAPGEVRLDRLGIDPRVMGWLETRFEATGWSKKAATLYKATSLVQIALEDPCNDFSAGIFPIQDSRIQMLGLIHGADLKGLEPVTAMKEAMEGPKGADLMRAMVSVYGAGLGPRPDNGTRVASFALYLTGQSALWAVWHKRGAEEFFGTEEAGKLIATSQGYLIDARNVTFLDAAEADLRQGGAFMAVGMGHLPGPLGLVEMMRERGFTVTRVPLPGEAR